MDTPDQPSKGRVIRSFLKIARPVYPKYQSEDVKWAIADQKTPSYIKALLRRANAVDVGSSKWKSSDGRIFVNGLDVEIAVPRTGQIATSEIDAPVVYGARLSLAPQEKIDAVNARIDELKKAKVLGANAEHFKPVKPILLPRIMDMLDAVYGYFEYGRMPTASTRKQLLIRILRAKKIAPDDIEEWARQRAIQRAAERAAPVTPQT
ncbi:MAG: hypothetical protein FJ088_14995, partial [Deltaproteobacteria bacterium]|nr:hypothetical protein [Deltaproteobacteria bacterium]